MSFSIKLLKHEIETVHKIKMRNWYNTEIETLLLLNFFTKARVSVFLITFLCLLLPLDSKISITFDLFTYEFVPVK